MKTLLCVPGYLLCRAFKKDITQDSAWIVIIGLLFWAVFAAGAWYLCACLSEMLAVDRCLDAGGAYDYRTGECVFH